MSFARRLLLVGSDHRFNQVIQTHLHKTYLLTAPVIRYEDLSQVVTRDTDGLLIFLASEAEDTARVAAAIRELRLQDYPPHLAMLCTTDFVTTRRQELLFASLEGCWVWPEHIRELNTWVKRTLTAGQPFIDLSHETPAERIQRKLLSQTPSLVEFLPQMQIAAAHDVTVLIEGETGTGKTHLARLIHECSPRNTQRFLVVSCGALSGNLIASEFFGHVKGAFTGADISKQGKFAAAGNGTLLLDEIDTLGLEHQANLLRVIETGEYEPVGSNETLTSNARVIAATNWNLADAVERGTFRRDLYYRLQVITFQLPPLRERPQDIAPLVRGLIARYGTRFSKPISQVNTEAMRALEAFPWPGNIRQLENIIQQAVLSSTGPELRLENLPPVILSKSCEPTAPTVHATESSLVQNRESTERTVIVRALERAAFSRTRAAQLLGVSRVTLYKKMKKYGLLTKSGTTPFPTNDVPPPTYSNFG